VNNEDKSALNKSRLKKLPKHEVNFSRFSHVFDEWLAVRFRFSPTDAGTKQKSEGENP